MTRDPFLRLALLAASVTACAGVYAAADAWGWWRTATVVIVGGLLAAALTVEDTGPGQPPDTTARRRRRRFGPAGYTDAP